MANKSLCSFSKDWLDKELNPQFSSWLKPVSTNKHQARCSLCLKIFELSTMGRGAVMSHLKSATHIKKSCATSTSQKLSAMLITKVAPSDKPAAVTSEEPSAPSMDVVDADAAASTSALAVSPELPLLAAAQNFSNFFCSSAVTDSEIIWSLKVVMNHLSFNSCKNVSNTFQMMFPDSAIAKKFTLSPAKVAYTIVHGLAPYFSENLMEALQDCTYFVACFDEALNKIAQRGQMDIAIRFWDNSCDKVATRYLTSVFLGHSAASDLEEKFTEGLVGLNLKKLVQISMDGPSVNWKFLETFAANTRPDSTDPTLFDLGSCGLHVVHGAFQTGHKAAGWTVNETLRGMYGLFKDSPARRADYTTQTGSTTFPKKFCQVRWIGNEAVATRAIEILPDVKKYVEKFDKAKKLPHNITCNNIIATCADPLNCRTSKRMSLKKSQSMRLLLSLTVFRSYMKV